MNLPWKEIKFRSKESEEARIRIKAAVEMFEKHFDLDGNPITDKGRNLIKQYEKVTLYNLDECREKAKWSRPTPILCIPDE